MFEKLKRAFSDISKSIGQKEISEKDIEVLSEETLFSLIESDVAHEVAIKIVDDLKSALAQSQAEKKYSQELSRRVLSGLLRNLFQSNEKRDIVQEILEKKKLRKGPYVIVFLGINGTGKTTSVAKISTKMRKHGLSVLLAAADTHRAGAIEQLNQHGKNLGIKVISQRYGADPSAVARDAVEHARKNYIDVVLIDTAGRIQTSKNLMEEIGKIVRVVKPDMKIFVGDSLSGNDTINQAREFFQYTDFDGTILTKSDADSKGGAAVSIVFLTKKPILFLGIGQGYNDLAEFDPEKFLNSMLENNDDNNSRNLQNSDDKISIYQTLSKKVNLTDYLHPTQSEPLKADRPITEKIEQETNAQANVVDKRRLYSNNGTIDQDQLNSSTKLPVLTKTNPSKQKLFGRLFAKNKLNDNSANESNKKQSNHGKSSENKNDRIEPEATDEVIYLSDEDIDGLTD
ncbi:MAG TPA: signal recognition particle-docking protein FtsY [Nitrososphaeraceae archaeon]